MPPFSAKDFAGLPGLPDIVARLIRADLDVESPVRGALISHVPGEPSDVWRATPLKTNMDPQKKSHHLPDTSFMRQNANVQESKSKLCPKTSWSSREKLMKAPHMGPIPSTSILRLKFELTKKAMFQNYQHTYGGWKKSCTTWDGWNPMNNGINHLSTGANFPWFWDGFWLTSKAPFRAAWPRESPWHQPLWVALAVV